MKKIGLILLIGLLTSCVKKTEFIPNENLIEFHRQTIMDMDELVDSGEENYQNLNLEKFNLKTDTIRFENDFIYISYLSIVNACGQYAGDIEIKNDSIYLKLVDTVGIACTSQRVDRLKFKIKNSENKKYGIKKW
ncbi:hypothetical protein RM697_01105 [Ichthyenterobacterium sp. W332]|uniref:Lipoprotein n=1 Tax=Microcosmobacter mediterraneus TaxID=3075607 RepID=A0ABU2YGB7_9FLAO|nr:hypothetical protein [Ichthyenterobacterium sp. W332]MDT0557224.1 hypothetical protein [Ichthyenterobacterium sp. W332]